MRTAVAYGVGLVRWTRLPSVRRGDCAQLSPGCWPGSVLRPVACGRRAVQGDGDHQRMAVTHAGCCGPPGCTTGGHREVKTAKPAMCSALELAARAANASASVANASRLVRSGGGCESRTREGLPQLAFQQCWPPFVTRSCDHR